MTDKTPPRIGRREALALFGGAGAAAFLPGAAGSAEPDAAAAASTCILTPEATEGPYWIPNHLTRRNITEGRPGLALRLRLTVVDATRCKTIKGADVELWHADASGVYSGFGSSASSQRFLRGHQRADAHGLVIFDTIYPGWYRGRTPHIHIKVHVGGSVVHTGQLFFNDVTSDAVYRTAKYEGRGEPDTSNAQDMIYRQAGGSKAQLHLSKRSAGRGYVGSIAVGVKR
jgi:protocatechuate 3,4-dioxygenase beta subunit